MDFISANTTIPVSLGKWLVITNNFLIYYGKYSGNLANTNLNNGRVSFNINSNNQFRISSSVTAEMLASYNSKSVNGFLNIDPLFVLSAGVQKQIFKKQGSIKLNVSDILSSNNLYGTTSLTGYREEFSKSQDTQVATLLVSYRFGKSQIAPSRKRASGAEEEKRRAGGS